MSNNLEEVKAVVDKLNALVLNLPEKYLTTQEYGDPYFSFAYNEIGMIITFKEEVLWCSENDDRDYDDENNDWYETLY